MLQRAAAWLRWWKWFLGGPSLLEHDRANYDILSARWAAREPRQFGRGRSREVSDPAGIVGSVVWLPDRSEWVRVVGVLVTADGRGWAAVRSNGARKLYSFDDLNLERMETRGAEYVPAVPIDH